MIGVLFLMVAVVFLFGLFAAILASPVLAEQAGKAPVDRRVDDDGPDRTWNRWMRFCHQVAPEQASRLLPEGMIPAEPPCCEIHVAELNRPAARRACLNVRGCVHADSLLSACTVFR